MADIRICSIENCGNVAPNGRKGWCAAHYQRWYKYGDPLGGRPTMEGEPLRYLNETVLSFEDRDACLPWPYATATDGRGIIHIDGKRWIVSRYVCERTNGPPPTSRHEAAHNCGKGHEGCVNRYHLEWKTRAENKADELTHGTRNRGERQGHSKLTKEQVIEIRRMKGRMTQNQIAKLYGVSQTSIADIYLGRSWSWL